MSKEEIDEAEKLLKKCLDKHREIDMENFMMNPNKQKIKYLQFQIKVIRERLSKLGGGYESEVIKVVLKRREIQQRQEKMAVDFE